VLTAVNTKEVRGSRLGHRFPGTAPLFTGLDFTMSPGQIVGLCGPSGSGKSTLLSILAGWVKPTEGTVDMIGVRRTGWVFQNPYGVPGRTALDLVCLPLLARGQTRAAAERRAHEVLASFRLERAAGQPFRELSGGEAQRLMLARAVCAAPDLLLVDEPTAQLDVTTAATVNETLGAIAQDGTIVVIATHDPHTRDACTHVIDLAATALHVGVTP
jgi:ABC-type lipoprotein export system ATPase subunit